MILGFMEQLVPALEDKKKPKNHTIRSGNRWRAGMRIHAAVGVRTKQYRLLFEAIVTKVDHIRMVYADNELHVYVNNERLTPAEREELLWNDGFRAKGMQPSEQAYIFWRKTLPFHGQLIHWERIKQDAQAR